MIFKISTTTAFTCECPNLSYCLIEEKSIYSASLPDKSSQFTNHSINNIILHSDNTHPGFGIYTNISGKKKYDAYPFFCSNAAFYSVEEIEKEAEVQYTTVHVTWKTYMYYVEAEKWVRSEENRILH